jgi:hypothetical protein
MAVWSGAVDKDAPIQPADRLNPIATALVSVDVAGSFTGLGPGAGDRTAFWRNIGRRRRWGSHDGAS